jgi:hypothetical protein
MPFAVGSLVRARSREWVVLPESDESLLMLRPLGGTDEEVTGIYLPLETVESASFGLPDPTKPGDYRSCRLLRDAVRLGFRSSAGPFRCFARIGVEPRPYQVVPLLMALKLDPCPPAHCGRRRDWKNRGGLPRGAGADRSGRGAPYGRALPAAAAANGTVFELFMILKHATPDFRKELLDHFDESTAAALVDKTIAAGRSVGTLNLALRELGETDQAQLGRLEQAIGVGRFLRLIIANGTVFELFMILKHATPDFRKELLDQFDESTAAALVDKTIAAGRSSRGREGSSWMTWWAWTSARRSTASPFAGVLDQTSGLPWQLGSGTSCQTPPRGPKKRARSPPWAWSCLSPARRWSPRGTCNGCWG